jgi:hypothetical protein
MRMSARIESAFVTAALAFVVATALSAAGQECGDPTDDEKTTAADALYALRAATALEECDPCVCDADDSGEVVTSDALLLLSLATGADVDLECPSCVTTTTTLEPFRVPCGDPREDAPACDGYCGVQGQMCVEYPPGSGDCQCIFGSTCGSAEGPPVCAGACDPLWVCRDVGGTCRCVF